MPIPSHLAKPHAVVIPFPAQGHINPMMSLAKYLSSAGVMLTFVHSARSYALLQGGKKSITDLHMRVEVVPDGLPTDEKEQPTVEQFLESIHAMENGFQKVFLNLNKEEHPPSCIISDSFLPWTQDVAEKYGIPRVGFWTSSATVYSIGYYLPQLVNQGYIPIKSGEETNMVDIIPGLLPFRVTDIPTDFLAGDIASPLFQFLRRAFSRAKEADRVLVHSFYDLERSVIDAMRAQQICIDSIGPLFPLADGRITNGTNEKLSSSSLLREDDTCLEWLDAQEDSSVIYVSFGSMATLTLEETRELAHGLEGSHHPFLWVIRPDAVTVALSDMLPEGFESRTRERGRIISWAPQLSVLAHPSVGGFLTHCGWNSTLESLWMGVPMIGCPRGAEQNTNLKCTIDWKVGMALEGQGKGGINRDSVEGAIKTLMQGEDGEKARRKALELRDAARTAIERGSSRLSLEKLVDDMKQMGRGSHVQMSELRG